MPAKILTVLLLFLLAQTAWSQERPSAVGAHVSGVSTAETKPQATQRIVHEGIAVDFAIAPRGNAKGTKLIEGAEATVLFKITDNNSGQPLSRLHPSAWIDLRRTDATPNNRRCREKIQSFLQASLNNRADFDLNTYFILSLNQEPNISVIDPLSGFGGSKLYTLVKIGRASCRERV